MSKPIIGIVGVGMVGGSLHKYFSDAIVYDIVKYPENKEKISEAEIIFICVPTPFTDKGFDLSIVREAIANLRGEKIVVIKSTVLPGSTEKMQAEFPQHKILFNPEFLTEHSADQDFRHPDRQIVGYTRHSYNVAGDIMRLLPLAPFERIMPATEAELVKYWSNSWFASKVVFANQMYDLIDKLSLDYERIKEAVAADRRIGPSHLDIWHGGYRGYGGKCLPKDMRALLQFAEERGIDLRLLRTVEDINNQLVKRQSNE